MQVGKHMLNRLKYRKSSMKGLNANKSLLVTVVNAEKICRFNQTFFLHSTQSVASDSIRTSYYSLNSSNSTKNFQLRSD